MQYEAYAFLPNASASRASRMFPQQLHSEYSRTCRKPLASCTLVQFPAHINNRAKVLVINNQPKNYIAYRQQC
jgi:hypothetical protein